MGELQNIVSVTIERGTQTVAQAGFGVPMILGIHTRFAEEIKSYASLDDVAVDFQTSDLEYLKAQAVFAQNPRPSLIKIGKRAANVAQVANVDVTTVTDSVDYVVTINSTPYTYNSGVGATAATIVDGLVIAINAGAEPITLTDNGDDFDLTADVAGTPFTIAVDTKMTLTETTPNKNIATEIARIQLIDDEWYFLISTNSTDLDITQGAAYIETQLKLFGALSADPDILTSAVDDIATTLAALNYDRTFLMYTSNAATNHIEAAWIGLMAPKDPGSATWKFKNLTGVTAETLNTTQFNYATGKSCNVYTEVGGVDITENGIVVSGEFIDIIRGTDWIQSRIEENVYSALVNNDKIPYTNAGIDVIKSRVSAILRQAIDNGILAADPAPVVTGPDVADVTTADKTNRILRDVDFTATYAGAIHKVIIQGKISV